MMVSSHGSGSPRLLWSGPARPTRRAGPLDGWMVWPAPSGWADDGPMRSGNARSGRAIRHGRAFQAGGAIVVEPGLAGCLLRLVGEGGNLEGALHIGTLKARLP